MEHSVKELKHSCFWLPQKDKRKEKSVIMKPRNVAKELDLDLQYSSFYIHDSFDIQLLFTYSFILITALTIISSMVFIIWKIRKLSIIKIKPFQNHRSDEFIKNKLNTWNILNNIKPFQNHRSDDLNTWNEKPMKQNLIIFPTTQQKKQPITKCIDDLVEIQI